MHVAFLVQIGYGLNQLFKDMFANNFGQALVGLFFYVVIDAHACTQLHYKVHMRSLINNFMQLHDVWVPKVGESVDFSVHCHLRLLVDQILFVVGFKSDGVLCLFVHSSPHYRKRTLANLKADLELFQVEGLVFRSQFFSLSNQVPKLSQPILIPH